MVMIQDSSINRHIDTFHHATEASTNWEYLSDAQGDVIVPTNKRVQLVINKEGWRDLSPLSRLGPNDIYQLGFNSPPEDLGPDYTFMPYVAGLTGLKVLYLGYSKMEVISDEDLRFLKHLRSLERLHLPGGIGDKGLTYVAEVQSLKGLYFGLTGITDEGLASLGKLHNLEELEIIGKGDHKDIHGKIHKCLISDEGLAHLKKLPNLQYLSLRGQSFTDKALAYVQNVPSLKILNVGHIPITDAGLAHISKLKNLENLALYNTKVTNNGLVHLTAMPSLKKLNLHGTQVTGEGLQYLKKIKTLEYLDLPYSGISDDDLIHLSALPNLEYLGVSLFSNSPLADRGLEHLSGVQSLEKLHVGGTGFTDAGMAHIAKLRNLRELYLAFAPQITNEGLAKLAAMKSLEHLSLPRESKITVSGLSHLNSLSNLTHLKAYGINQDNSGLDISGLVNLEWLNISAKIGEGRDQLAVLGDEDLECLAKLKRLEWLMVSTGKS